MDVVQRSEAEQTDFFDAVYERFLKAKLRTDSIEHFFNVAGTSVRFVFAGNGLVPYLVPALEHLRAPPTDSPDVTFNLWDSETTGVDMLPPPCQHDHFTDRGDIWGFNSKRI